MSIIELIWPSLENESLKENLSILEVSQIWAGAEPEKYNLTYSLLFKKCKKHSSKPLKFKVWSSLCNPLNFCLKNVGFKLVFCFEYKYQRLKFINLKDV